MQKPREITLIKITHLVWIFFAVKQVLLALHVPKTLVRVTAATRKLRIPLGHETRDDAEAIGDFLHGSLEERRAVSGFERL